jgi:hypothetical protein
MRLAKPSSLFTAAAGMAGTKIPCGIIDLIIVDLGDEMLL